MTDFKTAAVFSDHMVLQRNKYISIFGQAPDGALITASLFDDKGNLLSKNAAVSEKDQWLIQLKPQKTQTNCLLKITNENTVLTFADIAIGEVWLAGGQSNMEFELQNCTEGPAELDDKTAGKNVRFYYTNKIAWMDNSFFEAEKKTAWKTWDNPEKKTWSAVGYFFAKKLAEDLGCTVGLIGCNWGGTSASAWMQQKYLEEDRDLNTYLTDYAEATRGKSIEEQIKEYDDYEIENAKWQEGFSKLWEKDHNLTWEAAEKILGKNPWPGPASCKNPYRPTGLYNCMLARIFPYTLKGFLWYQGESDDHKPRSYAKLFTALIENWRRAFNDPSLPFIFVQLPVHRYEADPDFKHWPIIREQQAKVHASVKNTWLTAAFDLGQFSDIHPRAKKELGLRMEKNALANVYNLIPSIDAGAPQIEGCHPFYDGERDCGQLLLTFSNAPTGFEVHEDKIRFEEYKKMEENQGNTVSEDFTGFEVAGSDGVWQAAEFAFGGTDGRQNSIVLCSKKVRRPVAARYGWYNYGPVTIYSKNGLPLCPFQTGEIKAEDSVQHAKIQQIMAL